MAAIYSERLTATKGLLPQFIGVDLPGFPLQTLPSRRQEDPVAARELRESQTRLLIESIFNKSPSGLDSEERCRKMVSEEVWQWVDEHHVQPQSDAFKDGKIHQKVSIQDIHVLYSEESDITDVEVTGQLIRTGVLDREIFNQVWSLRANVIWSFNSCLRDCGRHPLLCTSFRALEKPVSSTQRHLTTEEELSIQARAESEAAKNGGDAQPDS